MHVTRLGRFIFRSSRFVSAGIEDNGKTVKVNLDASGFLVVTNVNYDSEELARKTLDDLFRVLAESND
jgi:hypothetical protein